MSGKQVQTETSDSPIKMELPAGTKNNICAYLDATTRNAKSFAEIISFLKRSRIFKAISTECPAYFSHQRDFWEHAVIEIVDSNTIIKSVVLGHEIIVSAEHLRRILEFDDTRGYPTVLNKYLVRGCFKRVKYDGDINQGVLTKSFLCPQYKYLAHVLQQCLSPRKGGLDGMRETIQSAFMALILNIPYNFSEMVFTHMLENITVKKEMYLMYARFLQMIINLQAPDLPKSSVDIIPLNKMTDTTMGRLLVYKNKVEKPQIKRMIGHLADPAYVAPGGKRWRHEDSDSDVENMFVPSDSDSSDTDEPQDGGPSGVAIITTTTAPEEQIIVSETQGEKSVEEVAQKKKKKRARSERSLADVLASPYKLEKKRKKKFRFVPLISEDTLVVRSGAQTSNSQPQTQSQQQQPQQGPNTSQTVVPTTIHANPSSSTPAVSTDSQIQVLNSVVMKLLADNQAQAKRLDSQDELIRKLVEEAVESNREIKELKRQVADQQAVLLIASTANEQQDAKIEALEESQRQFNSRMSVGKDGLLRIKGSGDVEEKDDDSSDDSDGSSDDFEIVETEKTTNEG